MGIFVILIVSAFYGREIHNDEAWIGQHVWSLMNQGSVMSELFADCPPLDREVVVYHKLIVWTGTAVSSIVGWGLLQLRAISLVSGFLVLLLLFWDMSREGNHKQGRIVTLILISTPVFWLQMIEFRPEALLLLLGTLSYLAVSQGMRSNRNVFFVIGGILAGLAGLTHAFGLVFALAGLVSLLLSKRWSGAILVMVFGLLAFSPYVSGFFTDRTLFLEQTIRNPLTTTSYNFDWWQPFVNLISEHKRILRKPEVIGLTVWFIIAVAFFNRGLWRRHRFLLTYLITLAVALAASPLPKFTRYIIPLVPFMAIVISIIWINLRELSAGKRRLLRPAFVAWGAVFFGYGIFALGAAAYPRGVDQIEINQELADHMADSSTVIAPFDFVYMQQGKHTIHCWWGADRAGEKDRSISFLEHYADSTQVDYLIVDPIALAEWHLDEDKLKSGFDKYKLIYTIPDPQRFLMHRITNEH